MFKTYNRAYYGVFGPLALFAIIASLVLAGCGFGGASFDQAFNGVEATMTTYNQQGAVIDKVQGRSFKIERDETFDSSASDGSSNKDSSVLRISLGKSHISHVGSSLVLAEDGLVDVTKQFGSTQVAFENAEPGKPWLNNLFASSKNYWLGKAKTILIRSQNGDPIAIFAGDNVKTSDTDVPKSTWFLVDGKTLLVYRCDYTVYDNDLLEQ